MESYNNNLSSNIRHYWIQILRRRNLFLLIFFTVLSIFTWGSFLVPEEYEAVTTFIVDNTFFDSIFLKGFKIPNTDSKLSMIKEGLFSENLIKKSLQGIGDPDKKLSDDKTITEIRSRLKININSIGERGVSLVRISYSHGNSQFAADLVNNLTREYIEFINNIRANNILNLTEVSQKKLIEYQQKLNELDSLIAKFLKEHPNFVPEKESPLYKNVESLQSARVDLEIKLKELEITREGLLKQLEGSGTYIDTGLEETPSARLARLSNQLMILSAKYTENHPDIIKTKMEIEELKRQMEQMKTSSDREVDPVFLQVNEELKKVDNEIKRLRVKLSEILSQENATDARIKNLSKEKQDWLNLQRERLIYQKLYDDLFQKNEMAKVEFMSNPKSILVAEYAKTPLYPARPDRTKLILIGFIIGIILSAGTVIGISYINDRFNDEEDIEKELKIPVLSVIPEIIPDSDIREKKSKRILLVSGAYLLFILLLWFNELIFKYIGLKIIAF